MPISATGVMKNNHRQLLPGQSGFTLLEVLVVLVIISITISFATITFDNEKEELDNEGERLTALMELASEEAIMNSREYRLDFTSDSYSFAKLADGDWQKFEEGVFRPRQLPEEFSFDVTLNTQAVIPDSGEKSEKTAVIFFLSSGETTPFELTIEGVSGREILISNRSGEIRIESNKG